MSHISIDGFGLSALSLNTAPFFPKWLGSENDQNSPRYEMFSPFLCSLFFPLSCYKMLEVTPNTSLTKFPNLEPAGPVGLPYHHHLGHLGQTEVRHSLPSRGLQSSQQTGHTKVEKVLSKCQMNAGNLGLSLGLWSSQESLCLFTKAVSSTL